MKLGALRLLKRSDLHDPFFEFVVMDNGFVLDPGLISVDRIHRIFEDLCDFLIVANPHPDQGKDPEIGIEQFVVF